MVMVYVPAGEFLMDSTDADDKVLRGGGWSVDSSYARAAYRNADSPNARYPSLDFRCAVSGQGE